MTISKITLFDNAEEAQAAFAFNKTREGFNTLLIGPTDIFRVTGPGAMQWKSGPNRDWYVLILTESEVWYAGEGVIDGPDG